MPGVKVWNGSAFVDGDPKIWNGSAFVAPSAMHIWDGSAFQQVWPTGPSVEFVASASTIANYGTSGARGSITPTIPDGTEIGDRVYAIQYSGGVTNNTFGAPAGWTTVTSLQFGTAATDEGVGRRFVSVYYRDRDSAWSPGVFESSANSLNNSHSLRLVTLRHGPGKSWVTPTASDGTPAVTAAVGSWSATTSSAFTTHAGGFVISAIVFSDNDISATSWSLTQSGGGALDFIGGGFHGTGSNGYDVLGATLWHSVNTPATGTLTAATTISGSSIAAAALGGAVFVEQLAA